MSIFTKVEKTIGCKIKAANLQTLTLKFPSYNYRLFKTKDLNVYYFTN